jgi:RecB family endonuclease NucS
LRVNVYRPSSVEEAARILNEAYARKALLVVLGRCKVRYEGRSASKLGEGDRLIIVKPDGAVLVHRPTGYSPVNWQPDSKLVVFEAAGEGLILRSVRDRPREVLEITFTSIDAVLVVESMEDAADFVMYVDEHEIRDYLAKHPEAIEPGLRVISVEKPVEPGFVDLYAVDSQGRMVIIEVKRTTAGRDAVLQLARYVEAFRKHNPKAPIRGILVAPSISKQALTLLNSLGLEYRRVNVERIYEELRRSRRSQATNLLGFLFSRSASATSRNHS